MQVVCLYDRLLFAVFLLESGPGLGERKLTLEQMGHSLLNCFVHTRLEFQKLHRVLHVRFGDSGDNTTFVVEKETCVAIERGQVPFGVAS